MKNVLFLCTGNSARSVLGESLMNELGKGRFRAFSAGSQPTGKPNPFAIELLDGLGHDTSYIRSKSWDEFAGEDAPEMDYVITVCSSAAGETCPFWPGAPVSAHWGIPDPAGAGETDEENRQAFRVAFARMKARVDAFLALPLDQMDTAAQKAAMAKIGTETEGAA
ncbi:arsenate reductase ArsC [Thalassobius sp. S69A]|uniref:arsenate reductase ArsC n=1 Tax=unclassified Thalassovita TaxID=2619711 RepID=UPI000C0DA744|nr:protein-tyrosine-phosphatase [Paracoccaceae bacterium]MBT26864.1 protein-tyrosine-phosphatase [Paracoccaceae bacterium]